MHRAGLVCVTLLLVASSLPTGASVAVEDPLSIVGNPQLQELKEAATLKGAGSAASPYILDGAMITAAKTPGLVIQNTDKPLIIRNATVIAGSAEGIRLVNVRNVIIEGADLQFNKVGIALVNASGTIIRDSTIRASDVGILLEGTSRAQIVDNHLSVNAQDVSFRSHAPSRSAALHSVGNVLRGNNLSIATGQVGLHFADIRQFDNDIDASNVVNHVPVRWHTHVHGTLAAPRVISAEAAHVKGMTNVGQIVCYNCTHVRLENLNASYGAGSGLVLERTSNITIVSAFAEGNEVAGIHVRNSSNVMVTGASAYANRAGVQLLNATGVTIASAAVAANSAQGIHIRQGQLNVVRGGELEGNGEGIALEETNRTLVDGATIRGSVNDGIRISLGAHNVVQGATLVANRAAGANLVRTTNATVTETRAENNSRGGIVIGTDTVVSHVQGNTVLGNKEAGIWLQAARALNEVEDNDLSDQAKHIRITSTEQNVFHGNVMTGNVNETGFWFDDEKSYSNSIGTSNLVNGTPVQWHVALVGSSTSPVVLRDIRVETANVTNVAQVMVYKGSYVRLQDVTVTDGVRGIFVLGSSAITIQDSSIERSDVGVELRGTQTGSVQRVRAAAWTAGVLLATSDNVTIQDVATPGARVGVEFEDSRSRGSVVQRIDATGALEASVRDPTALKQPRNLIADAGLDKRAGVGQNVTFKDTLGVVRLGSERIVRQSWTFGDGEGAESREAETLRPTHAYASVGNFTATYTMETADGLVLTDTVAVTILPPPEAPTNLTASERGRRIHLAWDAPASEMPITGYKIYRGVEPDNLTFLQLSPQNGTSVQEKWDGADRVWYAVTAESSMGESEMSRAIAYSAPAPEEDATPTPTPSTPEKATPLPGAALLALALASIAALRRRRD